MHGGKSLPEAEKVLNLAVTGGRGDVLDVDGRLVRHDECVCGVCCVGFGVLFVYLVRGIKLAV